MRSLLLVSVVSQYPNAEACVMLSAAKHLGIFLVSLQVECRDSSLRSEWQVA